MKDYLTYCFFYYDSQTLEIKIVAGQEENTAEAVQLVER